MKYIHPQGPKLINHCSGESLPDLWLHFSKGNTQQSQILSDGDSRTVCPSPTANSTAGEIPAPALLSKDQAWYRTTCVAQNSTVEFLSLKRTENLSLPRSYVTLSLLNALFKLLA